MDVSIRREFDTALRKPKNPVTIDEADQFFENKHVVMSPGWKGMYGLHQKQEKDAYRSNTSR